MHIYLTSANYHVNLLSHFAVVTTLMDAIFGISKNTAVVDPYNKFPCRLSSESFSL
jgi:hypothetical protein